MLRTEDVTRKYLSLARDEEKQTEENDNDEISSQSDNFHKKSGNQKVPQCVPHPLVPLAPFANVAKSAPEPETTTT